MFFTGETIDDAIEYYRPIADKENIQRHNSGSMIRSFQASQPNEREGFRCKQCMGVGHTSETCSTAPGTCFHCGLTGHNRSKCPSKNKKCWLKMKQAVLEIMNDAQQDAQQADNSEIDSNESPDSDSSVSDVCTDDEDDITEEEFSSPTLQVRTTRIQGRMATMKSSTSCNCTFHNNCLRIALDSGCTRHISSVPVTNAKVIEETTIIDAAGNKNIAKVEGDLDVHTRKKRFTIRNVKYCPSIDGTLLSVKQLIDEGYLVEFKQNCATIYKKRKKIIFPWSKDEGLYIMHCIPRKHDTRILRVLRANIKPQHEIWHYRMGHMSFPYLKRAGLPVNMGLSCFCPSCSTAKANRSPTKKLINLEKTQTIIPKRKLEVVFADTFGPIKHSIQGYRFW